MPRCSAPPTPSDTHEATPCFWVMIGNIVLLKKTFDTYFTHVVHRFWARLNCVTKDKLVTWLCYISTFRTANAKVVFVCPTCKKTLPCKFDSYILSLVIQNDRSATSTYMSPSKQLNDTCTIQNVNERKQTLCSLYFSFILFSFIGIAVRTMSFWSHTKSKCMICHSINSDIKCLTL